MHQALSANKHPHAKIWAEALRPLARLIVDKYKTFLPKLAYPIRVGEHTNTAFGLSFALDYARFDKDTAFEQLIIDKAKQFYFNDKKGPNFMGT